MASGRDFNPSISLGYTQPAAGAALRRAAAAALPVLLALALPVVVALALPPGPASADTRLVVREESWSFGRRPPTLATLVRTEVSGRMRRLENEVVAGATDSLKRAARHVQIDRVDRDTSYYVREAEHAYLGVGFAGTRDNNLRAAAAWRRAQAQGKAPRDTIPPVRTQPLARTRTIAGIACHGWLVALRFEYHDPAGPPGETLTGILADTLWVAPRGSAADPLAEFEQSFARATAADSFLAAPNAVQLATARGQGLVSVLTRAVRRVPGFALESSYENVLYGVPKGMSGVERRADGGVVVQRTVRRALELATVTLPPGRFDVPRDYRRLGGGAGGVGGPGPGGGGPGGGAP